MFKKIQNFIRDWHYRGLRGREDFAINSNINPPHHVYIDQRTYGAPPSDKFPVYHFLWIKTLDFVLGFRAGLFHFLFSKSENMFFWPNRYILDH